MSRITIAVQVITGHYALIALRIIWNME